MLVKLEDGQCRTCQNQLEIVDCDDATMHVECISCGDSYEVETDAFGDGCMTYYFAMMTERIGIGESNT